MATVARALISVLGIGVSVLVYERNRFDPRVLSIWYGRVLQTILLVIILVTLTYVAVAGTVLLAVVMLAAAYLVPTSMTKQINHTSTLMENLDRDLKSDPEMAQRLRRRGLLGQYEMWKKKRNEQTQH